MDVTKLLLDDRGAEEQAAKAAAALREYLQAHPRAPARLRLDGDKQVLVPAAAFAVFATMLAELAEGHAVTVAPMQAELTTQQAADLLNVSRPYLIRLLEAGDIPYRTVGNRRKVLLADLIAYRRHDDARRQAILDELTAEAQEMGLYD
jgi:excisionase family DNA binding protein